MDERVLRVSRLDALQLDEELNDVLQEQFTSLVQGLPFSSFLSSIKPELKIIIRFLLWRWSVWKRGATFGQLMMNLRYSKPKNLDVGISNITRLSLLTLLLGADWIRERVHLVASHVSSFTPGQVERTLSIVTALVQLAQLFNICIFLLNGRFPSLKERLLSLDMTPLRRQTLQQLNYEFTNREILWHGFSEFLFFLLPLFNIFSLRNWVRRTVFSLSEKLGWSDETSEILSFRECSFCEDLPVMPQIANCCHIFCYYCVAANVKADANYPCNTCGKPVYPFRHVTA